MDRLVLQEFPQDASALPVDLEHPNRTLIHGCFRETAQVRGQAREFVTYIPKDLEYCQPCIVVVPPSGVDTMEYLESSGLRRLADEKRWFLHLLKPQEGRWDDTGLDADFVNAVYVTIQARNYYITMQDNIYACGIGDGAVIAHQACQKMASEWSGLCTFGDLTANIQHSQQASAQAQAQGLLELKVYAQRSQLPVWIVTDRVTENVQAAIDYWKEQNMVVGEPLMGQWADEIWMPTPVRVHYEVNEEYIAQVRVTRGESRFTAEMLDTVWRYIGMARRHRSYKKKNLRYFKDPVACGAVLQERRIDGLARLWYEYVPAGCTPDKKWPLVLCMHGRGGTAETFFDISGMAAVAEERKFIAIFPQASIHQQKPGGLRNVLAWTGTYEGKPIDDVSYLRQVIADCMSRLPVDPGRVYSSGQSSGGIMTDVLCNAASDLFAACASWSGMYHPKKVRQEYDKSEPVIPTMFLVGDSDAFCTLPDPDPDFPFSLIPELKKDIEEKLVRYGLDKTDMQSWTCEPVDYYCFPDKQGVPMLTVGIVKNMAHANYPDESWISFDSYFSQFWKDEQGRLVYRGRIVESALR